MIAVFSLPLFAAWAMSDAASPPHPSIPARPDSGAAFFMGVMVFVRQHLLDRELIRLLNRSRESFDNLKRLQAQILQSEKLASIGQLVGGAAHELNNPITAMLGYSDMLLSTPLTPEQQPLAAKIGQYVRRTKSLVASLISFARQAPAPKSSARSQHPGAHRGEVDAAAMGGSQDRSAHAIRCRTAQGFGGFQPVASGLSATHRKLPARDERAWRQSADRQHRTPGRNSVLSDRDRTMPPVCTTAPTPASPVDPEDGLGLSACQGILQEHHGQISREPREDGAMLLRVELPVTESAPAKAKESTVPVLWQSRPYA